MMNQQAYVIAISCACLLICYYLYREINKNKADIVTLKDFSGNVGSFLERASQHPPEPEKVVATSEEPIKKEPNPAEAKKDD